MSEYSFNTCLKSIEEDDYAGFKENYEMGVSEEQSEYLLKASIMNHRKFFVEYLNKVLKLSEDQILGCQILASSNKDLDIFNLFIEGDQAITPQAWVNIFNLHDAVTIKDLIEKKGKPSENLLVILQYALANPSAEVHDLAFDKLYEEDLIKEKDARSNLIDCVCFSGNIRMLERLADTKELMEEVEAKQEKHVLFSKNLDEYTDLLYKTTEKEKVAKTVNSLGLMECIRERPDIEDWDLIIQDYLLNEELMSTDVEGLGEGAKAALDLLAKNRLVLLEIESVSPKDYLIKGKDLLEPGKEYELALDRRIHDIRAIYICYIVEVDNLYYVTSHPLFILPSKKTLIQLGLRKEKDRKQQAANKKNKAKNKKAAKKVSLSSKETYKYLLDMHIQSRKEIDDNV